MNIYINSFILLFLLFVKKTTCWSDEGHMVLSAIAYKRLTDQERAILNKMFANYKEDNNFNNPIYGASWPDHIKPIDYRNPSNTSRISTLNLMNSWHFVNNPYNPLQVKIDLFRSYYYKKADNGLNVLKKILYELVNVNKRPNVGTYFAYNFQLRFFIHIFGDIHQPLHNINFFNQNFTLGDRGGNDISVAYNKGTTDLHYLCDKVFFSRGKTWPTISIDYINKTADDLTKLYPPEYFGDRLNNGLDLYSNIDFIVKESYNLAVEHIYSYFPHDTLNKSTVYNLSNLFVLNVKKILNEQIAIGGYRLVSYLKIMIANVSPDLLQT